MAFFGCGLGLKIAPGVVGERSEGGKEENVPLRVGFALIPKLAAANTFETCDFFQVFQGHVCHSEKGNGSFLGWVRLAVS